jgi:hypothetical protein
VPELGVEEVDELLVARREVALGRRAVKVNDADPQPVRRMSNGHQAVMDVAWLQLRRRASVRLMLPDSRCDALSRPSIIQLTVVGQQPLRLPERLIVEDGGRDMRGWRKMTWALVVWTVLMAVWLLSGLSSASNNCGGLSGADLTACQAGTAIGGGLAVTALFVIWLIGFIVLSIVWFMTRPRSNVTVYGPSGQQVQLTEREAKRRVEKDGWTYQPRP